jgi:hypothetical protein
MTEAEAIASLVDIADIANNFDNMWVSVTFGFLTVSYFLGKALSRFQAAVISLLYLFGALQYAGGAVSYSKAWELLQARESTIIDEVWSSSLPWAGVITSYYIAGTLISLYFMYSIRSGRKE